MQDEYGSFLGTLRSELDEDGSSVDPAFEALAALAGIARTAFAEFALTPDKAAELFAMLRIVGNDGQEWTVGPTSGTWFSRPLGTSQWKPATLPLGVQVAAGRTPAWLGVGIDDFLEEHAVDQEAERARLAGERPDEPEPEPEAAPVIMPIHFEQRPYAEREREDADWLLNEWGGELRATQRRSLLDSEVVVQVQSLPEEIPSDWDAEKALTEAIDAPDTVAPREGSQPLDPAWHPVDRDEYLPPESFFLPPDEE